MHREFLLELHLIPFEFLHADTEDVRSVLKTRLASEMGKDLHTPLIFSTHGYSISIRMTEESPSLFILY